MASRSDLRGLQARAAEVEAAHSALSKAAGNPDAVDRFHRALNSFYDAAHEESVEALKRGEQWAAEYAVDFLVADPRCYRSGYEKELMCRYLGRVEISESQRDRLLPVARHAAGDPLRPQRERKRWNLLVERLAADG